MRARALVPRIEVAEGPSCRAHRFTDLIGAGPLRVLLALALVLGVWQALALVSSPTLFPGIGATLEKLARFYRSGELVRNVAVTTTRVAIAFALALVTGTAAGLLMGHSRFLEGLSKPIIFTLQTISSVIWSFFAVLWMGLTDLAVVFVVFVVGFPLIAIHVWEGVKAVDVSLEDMARCFEVPRADVVRGITIPSILPFLFAGIRGSLGYCWKIVVLAELMVGRGGIGYSMYFAWEQFRVAEVFAWVVVMVGLMLGSEYLVIRPIELSLTRWRPRRAAER
jgi:NitT/TauT family transport system permease protein